MLLTLRLWAALRNPRDDHHPLFRRILDQARPTLSPSVRVLFAVAILTGFMFSCILTFILPARLLEVYILLPFALPVVYLMVVFGGSGKGLMFAAQVSEVLAREYEQDTFVTVSTNPGGALGTCWAILTGQLHQSSELENSHEVQQQLTVVMFVFATLFLMLLYLNIWTLQAMDYFYNALFIVYPFVAIYYIDFVCSVVTSTLVGALAAATTRKQLEARVTAIIGFVALQLIAYGLTGLLIIWGLPTLIALTGYSGLVARISMAGLSVVIYFVVRELLSWLLWYILTRRLDAAAVERERVTNFP